MHFDACCKIIDFYWHAQTELEIILKKMFFFGGGIVMSGLQSEGRDCRPYFLSLGNVEHQF